MWCATSCGKMRNSYWTEANFQGMKIFQMAKNWFILNWFMVILISQKCRFNSQLSQVLILTTLWCEWCLCGLLCSQYHYSLQKNTEVCSSHLLCSGSLKTHTYVKVYSRYSQNFCQLTKTTHCTGLETQRVLNLISTPLKH